ncbi:ABC transporter family substrate-binding protein [Luteococcus sp. H138]|uniref:ABC transporter family substrate-binding protein n=1 Tax=unclassified Luteococcus TaxID=2639923 RepID=UPI00313A9E86
MSTHTTAKRWLATAAIVTLAFSGCGKAEPGKSDGGSSEGALAANVNDVNAKDAKDVGQGGTLRLANNAFPANWNVWHTDGNEKNTKEIGYAIFPTLYLYTPDGKIEPNPLYTKRIEKTSDSPLTMEIELKPDMKWSDGTAIDFKSIDNAFRVMSGKDKAYQIASSSGYDQVEKVEKGANEYTAKITFKTAYADWMALADVMPDALAKDANTFNTGWVKKPLVTAGPFKIEKADEANKTVSIVPDPDWKGDKPKLDKVLWTTIESPPATATSYKNGQLDQAETSVPATYTVLKDLVGKGSVLRKAAGPDWTHITLNGAPGRPLADVKVRQAVQRAMNRDDIFQSVNAVMPYPKDMPQQNNHLLVTNQDGYKDNSGDFGKYDVEAAKKLLTEAGYTMTDGKAMKNGKQLTVTYVYNDGSKTNEAVVPVVQEELKAIGINMQVSKVPPTDLFSKYVIPGNFDLTLFGWNGNPVLSSGDAIWKAKGEQNFGKVGSPEVDKLLEQAAVELDATKRYDLMNQIDAKLWELAGTVPLWQSYDFYVQHPDLANYGAPGFANIPDWTKVGYVTGSKKLQS